MTPTKEQMELAAKAAGYELSWLWGEALIHVNDASISWSPLTSGDDSQRLQVKLRIDVEWRNEFCVSAFVADGGYVAKMSHFENFDPTNQDDDMRSMREAIFLVAVEIGRAK